MDIVNVNLEDEIYNNFFDLLDKISSLNEGVFITRSFVDKRDFTFYDFSVKISVTKKNNKHKKADKNE